MSSDLATRLTVLVVAGVLLALLAAPAATIAARLLAF